MDKPIMPGRMLDGLLHEALCGPVLYLGRGPMRSNGLPVPRYSADLGAARALLELTFPGCAFGMVSRPDRDEVWAGPDDGNGRSSVSLAPGGRPELGLCAAILNLAIARRDGVSPLDGTEALADMAGRATSWPPERPGRVA